MKRMPIVFLVATFVLSPSYPAEAQKPPTIRKIGFLGSAATPLIFSYEVFRQSLRELGYVEGHNIAIEYRTGEGGPRLLATGDSVRLA